MGRVSRSITTGRSIALALAISYAGCGGGGAHLHGNIYEDREARYRIGDLGGGWEPVHVASANDLAWHDPSTGAIVQVNASCDPSADIPLSVLTNHLLAGFTGRDVREQAVVPLDGREALRTHLVARLDGVPRELLFYVMKKNECVYDFALIAPEGDGFASALLRFEPFVQGFTTEVPAP
jgi:hypothetical protein